MSLPVKGGLTYEDLWELPQDDGLRRELIDGELYVSPSPMVRHQKAVRAIVGTFYAAGEYGGLVLVSPMDVVFGRDTVVQPDVIFLAAETAAQVSDDGVVDVVPELLVEVSSPSTRRLDLVKKRRLYEREGVAEYWFVDLDAEVVDVYRLDTSGHYGDVLTLEEGEVLTCLAAPGLELAVSRALAT